MIRSVSFCVQLTPPRSVRGLHGRQRFLALHLSVASPWVLATTRCLAYTLRAFCFFCPDRREEACGEGLCAGHTRAVRRADGERSRDLHVSEWRSLPRWLQDDCALHKVQNNGSGTHQLLIALHADPPFAFITAEGVSEQADRCRHRRCAHSLYRDGQGGEISGRV